MYGITDESQLIDIETIRNGCEIFKSTTDSFSMCGDEVCAAAEMCNKKALSVDDATLEYPINELGKKIKNIKSEYTEYADALYAQALKIYNEQKIELAEYRAKTSNV